MSGEVDEVRNYIDGMHKSLEEARKAMRDVHIEILRLREENARLRLELANRKEVVAA